VGNVPIREFVRRVLKRADADDVLGQSAKLSYYLTLAVFPLLIFLVALIGVLAPGSNMLQELLTYWRHVLPRSAYELVLKTLQEISANASGGKLSLGLLGTLWAASGGVGAVIDGLNRAYKVKEGRPWWKAQLLSIVLTISLAIFIIIALSIVLYGNRIGEFAATYVGLGAQFQAVWSIIQWPIGLAFVLLAFMLLYRLAPDLHHLELEHVTPGAIVAVVLWLFVSMGLRLYLHYFDHYGATYGSLGAVIVLMLWFYLTGAAILIGGEVNAEIESTAARHGVPGARLPGEKEAGESSALNPGGKTGGITPV
jgi:membrane protein